MGNEKEIPNLKELNRILDQLGPKMDHGEMFEKLITVSDGLTIAEAGAFIQFLRKQKFQKSTKKIKKKRKN